MTSPQNSTTSDDGRYYEWRNDRYTSVTTILGVLSKSHLIKWSAKMAAEYAVENWGELTDVMIRGGKKTEVIDRIKGASARYTEEASNTGSMVHGALERHIKGEKPGDVIMTHLGYFKKFEDEWKPEYLACEATVYNKTEGYAGTFDFIALINGVRTIVDIKTGKSVYPEVALQLAAYANGEFIGRDHTEFPMLDVEHGAVLHLRPNGYKFIPVRIDQEVWTAFRYVKEAFRWQRYTSKTVLGYSPSRMDVPSF